MLLNGTGPQENENKEKKLSCCSIERKNQIRLKAGRSYVVYLITICALCTSCDPLSMHKVHSSKLCDAL